MTLEQLLTEVDRLDDQDLTRLLEHIEQRRNQAWARDFDDAVEALREGLSEEDIRDMVQAMNAEYVKPAGDAQWRD